MSGQINPGDKCVIARDIVINGQVAFKHNDPVIINRIQPSPQSPQHKYVVYSQSLKQEFALSDADIRSAGEKLSGRGPGYTTTGVTPAGLQKIANYYKEIIPSQGLRERRGAGRAYTVPNPSQEQDTYEVERLKKRRKTFLILGWVFVGLTVLCIFAAMKGCGWYSTYETTTQVEPTQGTVFDSVSAVTAVVFMISFLLAHHFRVQYEPNKRFFQHSFTKGESSIVVSGYSKRCPYCSEVIKEEAKVCRYCGRELADSNVP
jgi:hypothetical protein